MAGYGKAASKSVRSAMRRKKRGTLRSGKGGKGGVVKSRKQAIAIGLSEARKKGAKVRQRNRSIQLPPDEIALPGPRLDVKPGNRIARRVQIVDEASPGWIAIARPLCAGPQIDWNSPFFDPVLPGMKAGH